MSSGRTLDQWLRYQEELHPRNIDLGLDRVQAVWQRLQAGTPPISCPIIVVGGTNGKGSTIACLESIYLQSGYRPLSYTSPHIDCYNERVRIAGQPVSDQQLIDAFERVESTRETTSLSYFEFGTLAALLIASYEQPDVLILEVGLGGRLDAVNILQHDVAIITNVALDHMEWLGDSRDEIAVEKAAIARQGKPVVLGDSDMPETLHRNIEQTGALQLAVGPDIHIERTATGWHYHDKLARYDDLPMPGIPGDHQLNNAAAAIATVHALQRRLPIDEHSIRRGLAQATLKGRFELLARAPDIYCDVAHNPAASQSLCRLLERTTAGGRWIAVMALQRNRDIVDFVTPLLDVIDRWHVTALANELGHDPEAITQVIRGLGTDAEVNPHTSVEQALKVARLEAGTEDSVIIFGSFFIVSEARALLHV